MFTAAAAVATTLSLSLLFASAPAKPVAELPFKTVPALLEATTNARPAACPQGPVVLVSTDQNVGAFIDPESGRMIFVSYDQGSDEPRAVYFAQRRGDEIVVREARAFDPVKDAAGPCAALFAERT